MAEYVALIQDDTELERTFDDAKIEQSQPSKQTKKYTLMRNIAMILLVVNAILIAANVWATAALNTAVPTALGIQDIKDLPIIDQWANLPPASRESNLLNSFM